MKDIAFYYPGHIWHDIDRIKSMLLFFDGIGLLIPEYKLGEPETVDPVLAGPLKAQNLLHYFVADEVIDASATKELADAMEGVFKSGALEALVEEQTAFHSLSMSRLGYGGNREIAESLFERLKGIGLARDSEDGYSIPMHPIVRYLILVLLAQILRAPSARKGMELSPITDRAQVMSSLSEVLNLRGAPSAGHVVAFDLQTVAADMSGIPLDEVLDFRQQHLEEYRKYMRSLRHFAREISLLSLEAKDAAFAARQEELDEHAADLRRKSRNAWRKPATIGLSLAGAAWVVTGDPISALFAVGGIALSELGVAEKQIDAYSYLMSIRDAF